jgi:hypothetical protein
VVSGLLRLGQTSSEKYFCRTPTNDQGEQLVTFHVHFDEIMGTLIREIMNHWTSKMVLTFLKCQDWNFWTEISVRDGLDGVGVLEAEESQLCADVLQLIGRIKKSFIQSRLFLRRNGKIVMEWISDT